MENSETGSKLELTPGKRLREAREATGMSPREMADRLNWLPAYVAAIEEDSYEALRSTAFVRGYLRAYARAVDLDEDEIVAQYAALHPDAGEAAPRSATPPPSSASSQKTGASVVLGVVVAVIVIAAIWWKQQRAEPTPPAVAGAPAKSNVPVQSNAPVKSSAPVNSTAPAASQPGRPTDPVSESAPQPAPEAVGSEAARSAGAAADTADEPAAEPADPVTAPVDSPDPTVSTRESSVQASVAAQLPASADSLSTPIGDAAISADGVLQFSFSGDCWLEVRDGEGELIYADLRRAGDTLGLDGIPPFQILAGDADVVSLRYRGEPVQLQTRPGRDTARLTVGEP